MSTQKQSGNTRTADTDTLIKVEFKKNKEKYTLTQNTDIGAPQPRKPGKTALYWILVVSK